MKMIISTEGGECVYILARDCNFVISVLNKGLIERETSALVYIGKCASIYIRAHAAASSPRYNLHWYL